MTKRIVSEDQIHNLEESVVDMNVEREEDISIHEKNRIRFPSWMISMYNALNRTGSRVGTKTVPGDQVYNTNDIHILATCIAFESMEKPT